MKDTLLYGVLTELLPMLLVLVLFAFMIISPVVYLCGRANADYLKQTQNIDLPWYRAAFLDVKVINAEVKNK